MSSDHSTGRDYKFKTDDGRIGFVYFDFIKDADEVDVEFTINAFQDTSGGGDAFRIFATAKKAMLDTMKEKPNIKILKFSASKGVNLSLPADGRIRLYNRFAKMLAQGLKMKLTVAPKPNKTDFTLEKK